MQNAVCPTLLQPIKKLLEIVDFRKQEETELLNNLNEDVSVLTSIYVCEWEWDSEAARSKGSELLRQTKPQRKG